MHIHETGTKRLFRLSLSYLIANGAAETLTFVKTAQPLQGGARLTHVTKIQQNANELIN